MSSNYTVEMRANAINFVTDLIENWDFSNAIDGTMGFYEWRNKFNLPDVEIFSGATRGVILNKNDMSYVIKVQFPDESQKFNYCKAESSIYAEASKRGLDKNFAWCYFLANIGGFDFYIMEYINCSNDGIDSECENYIYNDWLDMNDMEDSAASQSKFYNDYGYEGSQEDAMLFASYVLSNYDELSAFIDEMDINDLHTGNWGYRGEQLVIVDYGGYRRNCGPGCGFIYNDNLPFSCGSDEEIK